MARGRAGRPDCAAYAGRLHWSTRTPACFGRIYRANLRPFCFELRVAAATVVVPCADPRRRNVGGCRTGALEAPERPRRGMRDGTLRSPDDAVRPSIGRRGPLGQDARSRERKEPLSRTVAER